MVAIRSFRVSARKACRQNRAPPDDPKLCRCLTKLTGGARRFFPIDPLFHRLVQVRLSWAQLAISGPNLTLGTRPATPRLLRSARNDPTWLSLRGAERRSNLHGALMTGVIYLVPTTTGPIEPLGPPIGRSRQYLVPPRAQ